MLSDGRVHVMDGAMGTMLYARGVFVNVCYDELNVTHPGLVARVHEQYVRAGAEIIETNTFGANPVKLSSYGLEDRTEALNRRAAEIALQAADGVAAVVGAVGPLGVRLEPLGPTALEEARAYYGRQVDGLLQGGVHGFLLETFSDISELEQAFRAVRNRTDLPVVVQVTVGEDCATSYGATVEQAARAAAGWGVQAVGINCSVGPAVILDGIERMARVTPLPLSALPNAGLPRAVGDRKMYLAGPEYMAQYARRLIGAGARIVGGCCGTTPEHIRRIREEVAAIQPRTPSVSVIRTGPESSTRKPEPPLEARSRLGERLARGDFVTSVRILPPRGWDASSILDECRALAAAGVDVASVYEDRNAARLSALSTAALIARAGAIEPVFHYTCRDRTLFEMISDLLGARASGLPNILLLTGDPPGGGPYPDFRSVVDIDSIGLTNVVTGLNAGVDPSGNEIGNSTGFVAGVALNQGARNRERELGRFRWKVEAGAHYAMTQPVFDAEHLLDFLRQADVRIPILAGVLPLNGPRQAEFLQNEVPGVYVPGEIVERMRRAGATSAERACAEGMEIAREVVRALRPVLAGIHVATHQPGADPALSLLDALGPLV